MTFNYTYFSKEWTVMLEYCIAFLCILLFYPPSLFMHMYFHYIIVVNRFIIMGIYLENVEALHWFRQ